MRTEPNRTERYCAIGTLNLDRGKQKKLWNDCFMLSAFSVSESMDGVSIYTEIDYTV